MNKTGTSGLLAAVLLVSMPLGNATGMGGGKGMEHASQMKDRKMGMQMEEMKKMSAQGMQTHDPKERMKMMQQHMSKMQDMMKNMQSMPMEPDAAGKTTPEMMQKRQGMMEERMKMMQGMMQQMMDQQKMMMMQQQEEMKH